jgi:thymidylate synthase ThyX
VFADVLHGTQKAAQDTYASICNELQDWLAAKLPAETPYRKKHARKQARGAARGFLGNALETQMCFTAPIHGWRHIVNMRAADAADAEIRVVISEAVECLKASRYGDRFADMVLVPASDGMGMALSGGGHK